MPGAGDRVRTGDDQLGRLTLYQLSYSRFLGRATVAKGHWAAFSRPWTGEQLVRDNAARAHRKFVEDVGFEPTQAIAGGFTVRSLWPLGQSSAIHEKQSIQDWAGSLELLRRVRSWQGDLNP